MLQETRHVQLHHQGADTEVVRRRRMESHESLHTYTLSLSLSLSEGMEEAIFEGYAMTRFFYLVSISNATIQFRAFYLHVCNLKT
jgi:hypothetical protein